MSKNRKEIKEDQDIVNLLSSKEGVETESYNGKVSKYELVQEAILNDIRGGKYSSGDKLPSEKQFCEIYDTSRITIRRALDELTLSSVLRRVQGVGTFVREPIESTQVDGKVLVIFPFALSSAMEVMIPEITEGMASVFEEESISFFEILEPGTKEGLQRFFKMLKEMNPLSIAYLSYFSWDIQNELLQLGCPVVYIDTEPDDSMFDVVTGEDYLSAYRAGQMLLNSGCKKVGFFSQWSQRYSACRERLRGVMDAVKDNCRSIDEKLFFAQEENKSHITHRDVFRFDMISAMRRYLEEHPDIDGLVTMNDAAATAALMVTGELGIKVPEDMKIISYGNYYHSENKPNEGNMRCPITSYNQNFKEYGRQVAGLLCKRIKGGLPSIQQRRVVKYELVRKKSF